MSIDIEKFKKDLDEWVESDAGKAYFEKERKKHEIKLGRYKRFEEWLKHNDFDKFMYHLILEHGEEWREKCWSKGCDVYLNNNLAFIFDYVVHNLAPVSVPQLENDFPTQIWFFKGYYFRIMHGQGSVVDIHVRYKTEQKLIFLPILLQSN